MPIPIPEALDEAAALARAKAEQVRRPDRYLLSSTFAGAFVGVAVVLMVSVSAPFAADGSPAAKLVQGGVFGVALTLVVFAGAELFTGNAMVMLQGLAAGSVRAGDLAGVWVASLGGNLLGSIGFAALVHGGGSLAGPGAALVAGMTDAKHALTGPQLLWRSVLCNLLVCLALWMAARTRSDAAKLVVIWWALLAFVASGFEHSVANMTVFSIGVFQGTATWGELGRNLLWTVPGNVVGGGLVVGLGYAWVGGGLRRRPVVGATGTAGEPAAPASEPAPALASSR